MFFEALATSPRVSHKRTKSHNINSPLSSYHSSNINTTMATLKDGKGTLALAAFDKDSELKKHGMFWCFGALLFSNRIFQSYPERILGTPRLSTTRKKESDL